MAAKSSFTPTPFVAVNLTRFRMGVGGFLVIKHAWLRVLGPSGGSPQILDPIAGEGLRAIAAFIRIKSSVDVRVNDILQLDEILVTGAAITERIFLVRQVQPEGDASLLHCSEIRGPIPDEFDAQSLGPFWEFGGSGSFAWLNESQGGVAHMDSMPADTKPIDQAFSIFQVFIGDFDVWTRLKTDAGSAGNVRNGLLGARDTNNFTGCWIGIRDNGAQGEPVRYDVTTGSPTFTTDTNVGAAANSATYYHFRLKRTGTHFQTFFRTAQGEPVFDSDWTEITNDVATSFTATTIPVRLELFGFTNDSTQGEVRWQFLRNWVPNTGPAGTDPFSNVPRCIHRNTATIGNVGGGLDSLHSFSLPPGSLVNDGDYLDIEYAGDFTANDTNKRVNASFGGTTYANMGAVDIDGSAGWNMKVKIIRLTLTSVRVTHVLIINAIHADSAAPPAVTTFAGGYYSETISTDITGLSSLLSNAMTLLVQGEGAANDDVTQNLSIIELCRQ